MTLERRLQINLAIMTSLGTLLLALAEGDARLGLLGVAVSASSVYFCDAKRWLVLGPAWSNIVGLLALVLTLIHWQTIERELLFIALANFLTYLQCILHYRAKVQHVYGMLMLLSFLQMAVASVLAATVFFGVLMTAYLWFALRTLCLFSILREGEEAAARAAARPAGRVSLAELFVTPIHRLVIGFVRRLAAALRESLGRGERHAVERPVRWPLIRQTSSATPRRRPGDGAVELSGLSGHVLRFALLTVLLAPLFFVVIPRPAQQGALAGGGGAALTGFSESVMLRDVTRIRENPDYVMRVQLTDFTNGRPGEAYELKHQPWLRGRALGRYNLGSWRDEDWGTIDRDWLDDLPPVIRDVLPGAGDNDLVLFEVTLERLPPRAVFTLEPAYRVPGPEPCNLRKHYATDQFERRRFRRNTTFAYQLLTTGLKDGRQAQFRPQEHSYDVRQKIQLLEPFAKEYLPGQAPASEEDARQKQRAQLQGLTEKAKDVLDAAGLDPRLNPRESARALERYLHHEGNFSYSLNPPPPPPGKLNEGPRDPVNDFVVHVKQGHCEYFASALALMLRSVGIPSRLVVGYKGGEWNAVGGYYEVRQFEAHAWVEAWIFDGDRPLGWLRLDPTPGEGVPVIPESPQWKQVRNYMEYLWSRYVLGMDATQQEELLRPLAALLQRDTWQGVLDWSVAAVAGANWASSQEGFDWRACLVVIGLQLILVGVFQMLRRIVAWVRTRRRRAALRRRGIPYVEFYVRLERLLALCGLCRRETQTPGEFAADSAGVLSADPLIAAAAPLLVPIVEAYYRVRFGGPPLTEAERHALAEELTRLEAIVSRADRAEMTAARKALV